MTGSESMTNSSIRRQAIVDGKHSKNAVYLVNRQIKPTNEEAIWLNYFLFSRANEFKDSIRKLLAV